MVGTASPTEHDPPTAEPPAEFDVYEFVLLRRGRPDPDHDDETAELLQRQHLGHLQSMKAAGHLLVAGPFSDQPDDNWRGLCVYRVGSLEEARRLAEADPSVRAGRLTVDVMHWYTAKGALPHRGPPSGAVPGRLDES
jgi:uncharacterized protein YciI